MRIAVASIMLDEPLEHLARWRDSAADADVLVLADTGSAPDTIAAARDLGITVPQIAVRPFRFDLARNAALAVLDPEVDLVVKLDADEVLSPGWRDALEDTAMRTPADRYSYRYVWSHLPDGTPDVVYGIDHIHTRFGWAWRHPAHEHLVTTDGRDVHGEPVDGLTIEHWPDMSKSRSQYLTLLEQAIVEDPNDDRMAHYYARELYFRGHWDAARSQFVRHLELPRSIWAPERAASFRYLAKMDAMPERWLLRAAAEDPSRRDAWVELAEYYSNKGLYGPAAGAAARALAITDRVYDYIGSQRFWNDDWLRTLVAAGQGVDA